MSNIRRPAWLNWLYLLIFIFSSYELYIMWSQRF
ncbi:Predicted membrane protein [Prochlorococcus marinus subsp. marinus str. CCMP1375]|uniref:Predicted membrane protein n=1 Tax=Prochlorococcus marinus (strain SARG / CCMP1375 / SS120) TaxID=167539 RepID=Q7VC53_PROMA|nr:Predicted membrane protein [Prochlorococcus marinus subsp. marinus str. CCMP1375]